MLLQISAEIGTLSQSQPRAGNLQVGYQEHTGLVPTHAEGNPRRRRGRVLGDDFGVHHRVIVAARDAPRHPNGLAAIGVQPSLVYGRDKIGEGGDVVLKLRLRSVARIRTEGEDGDALWIADRQEEPRKRS